VSRGNKLAKGAVDYVVVVVAVVGDFFEHGVVRAGKIVGVEEAGRGEDGRRLLAGRILHIFRDHKWGHRARAGRSIRGGAPCEEEEDDAGRKHNRPAMQEMPGVHEIPEVYARHPESQVFSSC
jgi:hypothetical protein